MDYTSFTDTLSKFISLMSKILPDDILINLRELRKKETDALPSLIYDAMFENQKLANELNRPCCQDTGVIQFFAKLGTEFPMMNRLQEAFTEAVQTATTIAPLRHNAVETFDEFNTGNNTGKRVPCVDWELIPNNSDLVLDIYMAGGGCTLPGKAMVLMPGAGYEGVVRFVLDQLTSYGINACPPLLVGIGIATNIDTAAMLSKKALLRPIGSRNENNKAANLELELIDAINKIGIGPQGLGGKSSVLDVHIENAARHPSTIGVAINVGCWSHRRGKIIFHKDGSYEILSHKEAAL